MLTQENTTQLNLTPDGFDTTVDTLSPDVSGSALIQRRAMRFLLDRHLGRLMTECPVTGEAHVSPVHYVMDPLSGAFVTQLPADSDHVSVLQKGGRSVLSVPAAGRGVTAKGMWHVQADVEVEVLDDPLEVRHVLRSQIAGVLGETGQVGDDPTDRAPATVIDQLVGIRMRPTAVWARTR